SILPRRTRASQPNETRERVYNGGLLRKEDPMRWLQGALALAGLLLASILSAQTPLGSEVTVQRLPQGVHYSVRAASAANDDFALVWNATDGQPHGTSGIFVQRFAADGTPKEEPFEVSGLGSENIPQIAMAPDGRFVVAWEDDADEHHPLVF